MTTIRDVAQRAGVSPATVSYVINNRMNQVGDETRQRVLKTMKELDYWPSPLARSLRAKTTGTIAFLISQSIHPVQAFTVSAGMADLFKRGYVPLIRDVAIHTTDAREVRKIKEITVRDCISRRVDGVVDLLGLSPAQLTLLRERKVPVVLVGCTAPPELDVDSVVVDSYLGGQLAAQHLWQAGYRQMACFHCKQPERVAGFLAELAQLGLAAGSIHVIPDVGHPTVAYDQLMRLWSAGTPIDAVFITADREALGVYRAIEEKGLRIPEQIGVVGFDDTFSVFMSPGLTSVAQPLAELGYRSAALIMERLDHPDRPATHVTLAPQLTVRHSTRSSGSTRRQSIESVWRNDF